MKTKILIKENKKIAMATYDTTSKQFYNSGDKVITPEEVYICNNGSFDFISDTDIINEHLDTFCILADD